MHTQTKRILMTLAALGIGSCGYLFYHRSPDTELVYWQRRALPVHTGMTRSDVEKILPPPRFDGLLWRLENLRFLHAPWLPELREAPKSALVHSDAWNLEGYEVAKGVFVTIRYDLAGLAPSPPKARTSVRNPGDHVLTVPSVAYTPCGTDLLPRNPERNMWDALTDAETIAKEKALLGR